MNIEENLRFSAQKRRKQTEKRADSINYIFWGGLIKQGDQKKYSETKKLLGQGKAKPKPQLQPLSKKASLLRTPPPPDELVGATNEPVHQEVGRTREAKSVRQKK